jgi:hypothetical protein
MPCDFAFLSEIPHQHEIRLGKLILDVHN